MSRLPVLLLLFLCLLPAGAHAQDASSLKQRTAARAANVASLIAGKVVREGDDGLLVIVAAQPGDQTRQLIADENRDRAAIFKLIASQTGETTDQVAALYAKRAVKLNPQLHDLPPLQPLASCNDQELASALKSRLASDEDLKAYPIQVDVTRKTVILSGAVANDLERTRAADVVRLTGCPVASVVNDLTTHITDRSIETLIHKAYKSDPALRTQAIKVEVSRGNVVLSGVVCENIMRTVAASKASEVNGSVTVTNNISVNSPCLTAPPPPPIPAHHTPISSSISGIWIGTFTSCAQGQSSVQVHITDAGPDDITASVEMAMPNAPAGTFASHGILNTMNNFLSLQFSGWQHQPPGLMMGNIGGYITFTERGATSFAGIVRSPGCGQVNLRKQ